MDVLLVLEEKVVHQLLHLMSIAIVDGCPCFLYDPVDLYRVGGVSTRLVGCGGVCWSLDCLHWLCVLLFDDPVDGCLCFGSCELGCRGLFCMLGKLLVLSLEVVLVLFVEPTELYLEPPP